MKARIERESSGQNKLWDKLKHAWDQPDIATPFEIATVYTKKFPNDFPGWIALADILVHMARYKEAHRALSRAEKLAPAKSRANICAQWGRLYNESCDLVRAEKWHRRAVQLKPTTTRLIFLGAVLAKQGRFAEAKRCHRRAIRLATDTTEEAYLNLGLILRAERRYGEALHCFDSAIRIDSKYKSAKEARTDVRKALNLQRSKL